MGEVDVKGRRSLILDTSAFIMGYDPLSVSDAQFTVPSVLEELGPRTTGMLRFRVAEQTGKLRILQPSDGFVNRIKLLSTDAGDIRVLSDVDIQILALALQLKNEGKNPVIVSDDYSIQNIAERIEVEYKSLATLGIQHQLDWLLYCPACYRGYPSSYDKKTCKICGTMLKRKPLRKIIARKKLTA